MTAWITAAPRGAIEAALRDLGLRCRYRGVQEHGVLKTAWESDEAEVLHAADAAAGAALLQVFGDAEEGVTAALAEELTLEAADAAIAGLSEPAEPVALIERMHRTGVIRNSDDGDEVVALALAFVPFLTHEHPFVRAAAGRKLASSLVQEVEEALAAAAEAHPELARVHAIVQGNRAELAAGTLYDEPTDQWWTLVERARAGLDDDQPERTRRALHALLDDRLDHAEGLYLRARLALVDDQPLLGRALAGAARELVDSDLEWREEDDDERETLQSLLEEIDALELPDGADATDVETWLWRFAEDDRTNALAGACAALQGRIEELDPLLTWYPAHYHGDLDGLRAALALAPDAPSVLADLGRKAPDDEREGHLRAALAAYAQDERSPAAQLIQRYAEETANAEPIETEEALMQLLYDDKRYDEAIVAADAFVERAPGRSVGWQIAANARIFSEQLEEAVGACERCIEQLGGIVGDGDSLYLGADPRPGMHFNLACVLARLDRGDEALDQLRLAVRGDDVWGERAREDDWLESLVEHPEFDRVVDGEEDALVLQRELEPEHIEALVSRATGFGYRGDADEAVDAATRAARLARLADLPGHRARALVVHARTIAFHWGELEEAVELAEEAIDAVEAPGVPTATRAEVMHEYAIVLHAAGQLDDAHAAYQRGLERRREAYGDDHPVLAKSYGELTRLSFDRGQPDPSLLAKGIALLERWLASDAAEEDRDQRVEARVDLANMRANRAHILRTSVGDVAAAIAAMSASVDALEEVVAERGIVGGPLLGHIEEQVRLLLEVEPSEQVQEIGARVEMLLLDCPAEELEERMFWGRIRRMVRRLRRHGAADAAIAGALGQALRGELSQEALTAAPELATFAPGLAERIQRYPTLLAMAAMALDLAQGDGSLDKALEDLEEISVGSMYTESGIEQA